MINTDDNKKYLEQIVSTCLYKLFPKSQIRLNCYSLSYLSALFTLDKDDKRFLSFSSDGNFIYGFTVDHSHLAYLKKVSGLNKLNQTSLFCVNNFIKFINEKNSYSSVFTPMPYLDYKLAFSFEKNRVDKFELFIELPMSYFECHLTNSFYRNSFYNNFKIDKNGNLKPVPTITFFSNCKSSETKMAFNIDNGKMHYVLKEHLYFDEFFELNQEFDYNYAYAHIFDFITDKEILSGINIRDGVRQKLILYPRGMIDEKMNLIGMYLI